MLFNINGIELDIDDFDPYVASQSVVLSLSKDCYAIERINFKAHDVVIDIGANIGIVSIYIAKQNPDTVVHAFEPVPAIHDKLCRNIKINQTRNVIPHQIAVTGDGRDFRIIGSLSNSGCCTGQISNIDSVEPHWIAPSITLDQIFESFVPNRCRLLKLDCEGSEHEIIHRASDQTLQSIDYLAAEVHANKFLMDQDYRFKTLYAKCRTWIPEPNIKMFSTEMIDAVR